MCFRELIFDNKQQPLFGFQKAEPIEKNIVSIPGWGFLQRIMQHKCAFARFSAAKLYQNPYIYFDFFFFAGSCLANCKLHKSLSFIYVIWYIPQYALDGMRELPHNIITTYKPDYTANSCSTGAVIAEARQPADIRPVQPNECGRKQKYEHKKKHGGAKNCTRSQTGLCFQISHDSCNAVYYPVEKPPPYP
jgi:hypothetical protein